MVVWELLDANCDEETQQATDIGSLTSLYEVVKLAYFEPDEKVLIKDTPNITGCAAYGFVAIAIDHSIYVFGENCSSLIIHLTLGNVIEIMIWIPGGEFLFLVDSAGLLHCLHIESKTLIFTKKLPLKKSPTVTKYTVCGQSFVANDGSIIVVIITTSGQIVRMENIDKDALLEGLKQGDLPFLNSLQSEIRLVFNMGVNEECTAYCAECIMLYSKLWIWIGTEHNITCWNSESLHSSQPISYPVANFSCLKLAPILDGRYIAAVNEKKFLSIISFQTGLIVYESEKMMEKETKVHDFYELSSDFQMAQLLILAERETGDGLNLIIVNIPSFEITYDVPVNKNSCILKLGEGADAIALLEPEFVSPYVTCLKLKSVIDGLPDNRLEKLLRKHKFNEAEEFCGTFGLNVEQVHKAKSCYLCDLINPWGRTLSSNTTVMDTNGMSRHFDDLLLTLGRIEDNEFVTTLCEEALILDIGTTERLLNYAKHRLAKAIQSGTGDHLSSLMQKISKKLYCLHTFKCIYPASDVQQWFTFSGNDMLKEFLEHLKRGELDIASTVWHRHQYEFLGSINEDCVSKILRSIPITISSDVLYSWLPKNLIKDLVKFCPSSIEVISAWTDNRIKKLEIFEKNHWPSNGYAFATTIINAIENVASDFFEGGNIEIQMAIHVAQRKAQSPSSCLFHLRQTAHALRDLQILAKKFLIKIKFSNYTQKCKKSVVASLLDWLVSGEEVQPLMEGFLRSYMIRHDLNCDDTLNKYVMETLSSADHDWWLFGEAPWEDKLYAVIIIISDLQIRAECIVECVRLAPVPWSEGTVKMCAHGMTLNTSLTQELELQERLGKLKIVLRRHNLHLISFDKVENAELILMNIISQEKEGILEDALVVVSAFNHLKFVDVYFFRLSHLIRKELYEEGRDLLLGIDNEAKIVTSQKFISYVYQNLNVKSFNSKCSEKLKYLTSGVIALEDIFRVSCSTYQISETFWSDIQRINAIQTKFNLFPALDDLHDIKVCSEILKNYLEDSYLRVEKPTENVNPSSVTLITTKLAFSHTAALSNVTNFKGCKSVLNETKEDTDAFDKIWEEIEKIQHLSWLLGLSRQDFLTLLATLASEKGYLEQVLKITDSIAADVVAQNFTSAVYNLIKMVVNKCKGPEEFKGSTNNNSNQYKSKFMNIINQLLSSTLITCSSGEILMVEELAHWCHISKLLFLQCHRDGIYICNNASSSNDPFVNWKFSPVFSDHTMPIEESVVAKAISNILEDSLNVYIESKSIFNLHYSSAVTINCFFKEENRLQSLINLTSHLRERSHDLLALMVSQSASINAHLATVCNGNTEVIPKVQSLLTLPNVTTLLVKVLSSEKKDLNFTLCLLSHLSDKEALRVLYDVIKRFGYDFDRLILVGKIGSDYCKLNNLKDIDHQFSVLFKRASWGKQLEDLGIPFKNGFSGDKKALTQVLKELVSHSKCSFYLIFEFCEDFSWDITEALSIHLKHCLRSWTPCLRKNLESKHYLVQDIPSSLRLKINSIVSKIENKVVLRKVLEEELHDMSSYNYEMLEIIISHLYCVELESVNVSAVNRNRELIQFLKVYVRQKPPGAEERDEWYQSHPECRDLPLISQYRLPFHGICNVNKEKSIRYKILEMELDVNCVHKWIQFAESLKISTDQLYYYAVQTTVKDNFKKELQHSKDWQICSRNKSLLLQIQSVITKIRHHELTVACANWVVNNLPSGADQVDAAKKCSLLAQYVKTHSNDKKFTQSCKLFEIRYLQLAIEHILHKYGLAQPEYLALMKNPVELMNNLYNHPCLSSYVTLGTQDLPDINGCVTEICKMTDLNQTSLQLDLLHQWLPMIEKSQLDGLDDTISNYQIVIGPTAAQEEIVNHEATPSLSRVIYLLRCYPEQQAISYLLNQAFAMDENVSTIVRLKALRCLLAIADQDTIQNYSILSMEDVRSSLQTMTYVSRLESLGHATSISLFTTINKSALAEGLWCSQRHNPEGLLLIVDLCCDFNISTTSLWGVVMEQLTKFVDYGQMKMNILEKVLLQIKNIPHLWLLPQLVTAWELVIYYPFKKGTLPVTGVSLNSCVHSINLLLQYCPVEISIDSLALLCGTLELQVLELVVLASYPNRDRDIQKILSATPKEKLKSQYNEVKTILVIPKYAEDLLESS